jgi:hypothetical protein
MNRNKRPVTTAIELTILVSSAVYSVFIMKQNYVGLGLTQALLAFGGRAVLRINDYIQPAESNIKGFCKGFAHTIFGGLYGCAAAAVPPIYGAVIVGAGQIIGNGASYTKANPSPLLDGSYLEFPEH